MAIVGKFRAEGRPFGRDSTLHGAESADASRAGMHFMGWVVVLCGIMVGGRVWKVGWATETRVDVIIKGATFSPLHQDTVE